MLENEVIITFKFNLNLNENDFKNNFNFFQTNPFNYFGRYYLPPILFTPTVKVNIDLVSCHWGKKTVRTF